MSLFYLGHPKETDLALFAGGELGPLARWRIERHLQSCEACQTDVADFFHLQSDLEELGELPSSVDWDAMALRIREAVAEADETQTEPAGGFFQKPLAWQLGLATAAVFCGFIVIQQFPMQVDEPELMTAVQEQDGLSSGAEAAIEAELPAAVGGSLAPAEALNEVRSVDQKRKSQSFADVDSLAPAPSQERSQAIGAEKKNFELAARTEEALPGDRMSAAAPPPAAPKPARESARMASNLRENSNARIGADRDALQGARGRTANATVSPTRQKPAQRKDDAVMNIALADRAAGPAALREEFDQPVGEKEESSADELRLAKARVVPSERRAARMEGQGAQLGAAFAVQPDGLGHVDHACHERRRDGRGREDGWRCSLPSGGCGDGPHHDYRCLCAIEQ